MMNAEMARMLEQAGYVKQKKCQVIGYSVTSDERVLMCQLSCGHRVPSLDLGPFNPSFSHCPRCNAKVVQDDN